ncbi:MAG: quinone-dependent dihydroorotate dehydrogenase [Aestuariivirga sp.]|uniref:quinone-dependent dihydroorotate dehydrogenase n=1 Tax=Aestuariivirga sp. TaxID=2650926 RepID=UPI0025C3D88F|nr:quinone-dependent dihydroorotate dehydrogenase [Aestuariivirga sp.]MCA3561982.1 quinone-dependent dihydroorotate dehydrogenase [Aestuariivirga sp.]
MKLAALGFSLARPLLHALDAETAHGLTIRALSRLPMGHAPLANPALAVEAFGLGFPNPLGLAAGFDKNAEAPDAVLALGFGFTEIGTVTPKPQPGNPRPRLFRLPEDGAVINRMGFNNEGHSAALRRLAARQARGGIVGVNIGANRDSSDRIGDYVQGIAAFAHLASYFTVNISSPNTPGLRGLQSRAELEQLLARLNAERARQARKPPMLLKIAPDLREDELQDIASACAGGAVDGIIVSNTTLSREGLCSPHAQEQGGLSGRPLLPLSTRQLARMFVLTRGEVPLIGVGGVHDGASALLKIRAGASLVQLYSALVYQGPGLVTSILAYLSAEAARGGPLASQRGRDAEALAHQGSSGT